MRIVIVRGFCYSDRAINREIWILQRRPKTDDRARRLVQLRRLFLPFQFFFSSLLHLPLRITISVHYYKLICVVTSACVFLRVRILISSATSDHEILRPWLPCRENPRQKYNNDTIVWRPGGNRVFCGLEFLAVVGGGGVRPPTNSNGDDWRRRPAAMTVVII